MTCSSSPLPRETILAHKPVLGDGCLQQRHQRRNQEMFYVAFSSSSGIVNGEQTALGCSISGFSFIWFTDIFQQFSPGFCSLSEMSSLQAAVHCEPTQLVAASESNIPHNIKAHCLKVTASILSQGNYLSPEKTFCQYLTTRSPG